MVQLVKVNIVSLFKLFCVLFGFMLSFSSYADSFPDIQKFNGNWISMVYQNSTLNVFVDPIFTLIKCIIMVEKKGIPMMILF